MTDFWAKALLGSVSMPVLVAPLGSCREAPHSREFQLKNLVSDLRPALAASIDAILSLLEASLTRPSPLVSVATVFLLVCYLTPALVVSFLL